jgi:hypothetical protein
MTETPVLDADAQHDDHYLPQEAWDEIVARANEIYVERGLEGPVGGADYVPPAVEPIVKQYPNSPNDKSSTLVIVPAQLYAVHTGETPLRVGYASSLTEWADGDTYTPRVSWRAFVDPATVCLFIPRTEAAWHAAGGNTVSLGYEQSGYASYSRAQWLSPDGSRQIDLLGEQMVKDGLRVEDRRWLSDAQVKAILTRADKTTRGLCTHEQISRLTGRSSRTDPGAGYPKDVLQQAIAYHQGDTPDPVPVPPPTPTLLVEDGKWGAATTSKLQRVFGTQVDGEVSNQTYSIRDTVGNPGLKNRAAWEFNATGNGSGLIRAMQTWLKAQGRYSYTVDGLAGPGFWKGLSGNLGLTWDGNVDDPDPAVKKMQYRLNRGTFK